MDYRLAARHAGQCIMAVMGVMLLMASLTSPAWADSGTAAFQLHTDRPGFDYADFDVNNGARACQQRCREDDRCKAWTFVGPHAPKGSGHCWLKDAVPQPEPMKTAVSGVIMNLAFERWRKPRVNITTLDWVDRLVRVGDIDNFGYGWPADYNPFSGRATPPHGYPFEPEASDPAGTDRIMLGSGYDGTPPNGNDGYTTSTSRPGNKPRTIVINLPADRSPADRILLQMFVDDFQAPVWGSYFQVTLDGKRMPGIEQVINELEQTGPIGKLISVPLLPAYHICWMTTS